MVNIELDGIINMWDFGDKSKAFALLVQKSKEAEAEIEKLNKQMSDKYLSGKNDKDKKIVFNAIKKTDWFKTQVQNEREEIYNSFKSWDGLQGETQ